MGRLLKDNRTLTGNNTQLPFGNGGNIIYSKFLFRDKINKVGFAELELTLQDGRNKFLYVDRS